MKYIWEEHDIVDGLTVKFGDSRLTYRVCLNPYFVGYSTKTCAEDDCRYFLDDGNFKILALFSDQKEAAEYLNSRSAVPHKKED